MYENSKIRKNYVLNTINQLLSLIVPIITAPYLARVLTSDGIGIFSFTHSVVTYFSIAAVMGSSSFAQREIAYTRDDKIILSESFWNIVAFRIITTCVCTGLYFVYVLNTTKYSNLFIIFSIQILSVAIDINWFFQGIEDFGIIVKRGIAIRIVHTLSIFIFIKGPEDLWKYVLMTCMYNAIGFAYMWIYLPKHISRPILRSIRPFRNIKDIFLLFLPTIATQIYAILDKSMIGWITNSTYQNGCYEQAEKIARISLTVITSISVVILPRIANFYKKGRLQEAKGIVYKGFRFTFLFSLPMTFGLITIADIFVPVFFGDGYELAILLLQIFSLIIIPVSLAHVVGYSYLIPTKQQNVYTISVSSAAVLNLAVNFLLIPKNGAIGAAIGSVVAEVTGILLQLLYCCTKRQLSLKFISSGVWKYLLASIIMSVLVSFVKTHVHVDVWGLVACIITGIFTYLLAIFVFQDRFFIDNVKRINSRFITHFKRNI